MANYRLRSQLNKGKYKGQKVYEVINTIQGRLYLAWLHNSDCNVRLTVEVTEEIKKLNDCSVPQDNSL